MNVFIVSTGTIFHGATQIIGVFDTKELALSCLKDKTWTKVEDNVWQCGASFIKIEEFGIKTEPSFDMSLLYNSEFRDEQRRLIKLETESEAELEKLKIKCVLKL